jgi:NADPH:quinone reductase-like Zn-dependent oxidoreductase
MSSKTCFPFFSENQIRPIIDTVYPFEAITLAQNRVENGQNFGKVVVTIP